jgi:hypothetical protein
VTEESDLLFRPGVRLAVDYFLESADRIVRTLDEDLGPSVVFLAAVWANVANQAAAFAATGEPPDPDAAERRMPVTVLRLSQSLGLPFETVRRYASRLGASGYCQRQSGGLVVQGEIFQRPAFDACLDQTWAATARLARDLEAVGVVLPPPSGDKTSEARRWVARLSARHFLRGLDLITRALEQDFLSCLVFLAINRANTSMLFEDAALARAYAAPDALREDALRRPAPVIEIARALRLPYETTRRRALLLVEAGLCERLEGGLVAPAAVLASPRVTPAMLEAWRLTYAFMISSRRLGVA